MDVRTDSTDQANPVAWLKRDHEVIRGYLQTLSRSSIADGRATFEALKRILSLHNAIEENLVYPALAKVAGARDQAMELFHETAEADILVYTATRAALEDDEPAFNACMQQLTAAILEHVTLEETQAFPALERASRTELQSLAHQILQFKSAMGTAA
jgi:hemerythrin superfamily protein